MATTYTTKYSANSYNADVTAAKTLSQTVTVSESVSRLKAASRSAVNPATYTQQCYTDQSYRNAAIPDVLVQSSTNLTVKSAKSVAPATQTVSVSDNLTKLKIRHVSLSINDSAAVSGSPAITTAASRTLTESTGIADQVDTLVGGGGVDNIERTIAEDPIVTTDSYVRTVDKWRKIP